jgi:hypothetical protein
MIRGLVLLFALTSLPACSPCAGVLGCSDEGDLRVQGRLVDPSSGIAAADARLRLTLDGVTSEARTDGVGEFTFTRAGIGPGLVSYDLEVSPKGESTYVAHIECIVSTVSGSGCPLRVMTTRPSVLGGGFVHYRGQGGPQVDGTPVVFRRTGGVRIYGTQVVGDSIAFAIDPDAGHINLLPPGVFAREVGDLVGDLFVQLPAPLDSSVLHGIRLPSSAFFRDLPAPVILAVGPSVRSRLIFRDGAGRPVAGVAVRYTPTGGVTLDTAGLAAISDDSGSAVIDPRPLAWGIATGTLVVDATASGGASFSIAGLSLRTFDDDSTRTAGTWNATTGAQASSKVP